MSKTAPTLADALIREQLKPEYRRLDPDRWFLNILAKARKFVLDQSMSSFLPDLAYASLLTCDNAHKAQLLMDGMRVLARLPHQAVFIEYDKRAQMTRAHQEYNVHEVMPDQIPDRCGWLCLRHPTLDTAFMAFQCSSHSWDTSSDVPRRDTIPQPAPVGYQWRCEEGPPPWPMPPAELIRPRTYLAAELSAYSSAAQENLLDPGRGGVRLVSDKQAKMDMRRDMPFEAWATGVSTYRSEGLRPVALPFLSERFLQRIVDDGNFDLVVELSSDVRYLWALLATLNDLPTSVTEVRPTKGYVGRGRWRPFVEHKVITLTVPQKLAKRIAARAIAIARRKAHPVRGHWRRDWRHPLVLMCHHDFRTDESGLECKHCHGRRIWVHDHQRGDAQLGFVLHDYRVEHPKEKQQEKTK